MRGLRCLGTRTKIEPENEEGYAWYSYLGLVVHDPRRSAVRNLRLAGVSESVIVKISGYRTAEYSGRYNIFSTDDVTNAMRAVEFNGSRDRSVKAPPKSKKQLSASRSKQSLGRVAQLAEQLTLNQ